MKHHNKTGFALMACAMILVSTTVVVSKVIGESMPPFFATALRFAISTPIFLALMWLTKQRFPKFTRHEWILLCFQAAAGSVAYTVLLITGLTMTSGANASVIIGTLPVVMGVLAITSFGERATFRLLASICVAGLGMFLITLDTKFGQDTLSSSQGVIGQNIISPNSIGMGLLFLAVLCEAIFLLLNKKISTPIPALTLSALMSGFGLLLSLIPAGFEFTSGALNHISVEAVYSVIYYALVPTVIGFLLWYQGSWQSRPADAAFATAIMPIAALVFVFLILNEPISVPQILGCSCVVLAILVGMKK